MQIQYVPRHLRSKHSYSTKLRSVFTDLTSRWKEHSSKESFTLSEMRSGGGTWSKIRSYISSSLTKTNTIQQTCSFSDETKIDYEGDYVIISDLSSMAGENGIICLIHFVELAALDSRVLSITIEKNPILLNYAARGVIQSGVAGHEPYLAAGLSGEGQVVGIADSGLNDLSCFFYDTSNAYPDPQVTRSTIFSLIQEKKRRKVIQYIAYADDVDAVGGHGTHVCGTIAGNSIDNQFSFSNGIVPNAKIAFLDMQQSDQDYISVPNLYYYVFKAAYDVDARVHSNSWGSVSSGNIKNDEL